MPTPISADSASKRRPVAPEISEASVVLPVPGGPYRMTDAAPDPSTRRRKGDPGPSRCSWPTTSSSDSGRIRTARGAPAGGAPSGAAPLDRSNRPSDTVQAYHGGRTHTMLEYPDQR